MKRHSSIHHRFSLPLSFAGLLATSLAASCAGTAKSPVTPAPTSASESRASSAEETEEVPEYELADPGLDVYEIVEVIQEQSPQMRQCYVLGSFKNAQLTGVVNIAFTIAPTGKVSKVSDAGSKMEDQEVVDCVMEVFAKMEFRPGGGSPMEMTYPISFGQQG